MKKIFLRNKETGRWYNSWSFLAVVLALAIIFSPIRPHLSNFLLRMLAPVVSAETFVVDMAESVIAQFRSKTALEEENAILKAAATVAGERLNYLSVLREENTNLKKLLLRSNDLVFSSTSNHSYCPPTASSVGARTLLSPETSFYSSIIIDIGHVDQVAMGDKVYSFGDVILGVVSDVYPEMSRVELYSSPNTETAVFLGKENVAVTIKGDGDGMFKATLPKNISISAGDSAIIQDARSALVAKVGEVRKRAEEPFEDVYLKSPVNLRALRWVYVDRRQAVGKIPGCKAVTL